MNTHGNSSTPLSKPCPICGHAMLAAAHKPFCSERCQNVDLYRWLTNGYAVPAEPGSGNDESDDELSEERE